MTDKVEAVNTKLVDAKTKLPSFEALKDQKASSAQRHDVAARARQAKAAQLGSAGGSQVGQGSSKQKNGQITQTVGGMVTQTGTAAVTVGNSLIQYGQAVKAAAVAAAAVPGAGAAAQQAAAAAGDGFIFAGIVTVAGGATLIVGGIATTAAGTAMVMSGNDEVNKGNATLAKAANEGIIANNEAVAASAQLERASFYESEIQITNATIAELEAQHIELSASEEKDLQKNINDGLKRAATTHRDGDILTLEDKQGNERYFMRDANGSVNEVDVKRDEDGNILRDDNGALQFDKAIGAVDENDPMAKDIAINFILADNLKDALEGNLKGPNGEEYPARTRLKLVDGKIQQVPYNVNNPTDMNLLIDIFESIENHTPEYRLFEQDGELGIQKWDYANDKAQAGSEFVSIEKGFGSKEQAQETLRKMGIVPGTALYDELMQIADATLEADKKYGGNSTYKNILAGASQKAAGGERDITDLYDGLRTNSSNSLGGA